MPLIVPPIEPILKKTNHSEYTIWIGMLARCNNPTSNAYKHYGGRGIKVCKQWTGEGGYEAFVKHIGYRPSLKYSVDRIDVNGNYEPGNVRWATIDVQANNRRNSKPKVIKMVKIQKIINRESIKRIDGDCINWQLEIIRNNKVVFASTSNDWRMIRLQENAFISNENGNLQLSLF